MDFQGIVNLVGLAGACAALVATTFGWNGTFMVAAGGTKLVPGLGIRFPWLSVAPGVHALLGMARTLDVTAAGPEV
jgi:hypothetical protein